jgi:hypothetical protein
MTALIPIEVAKFSRVTVGLAQRTPGPLASAMGLLAAGPSHFQQHVLVLLTHDSLSGRT